MEISQDILKRAEYWSSNQTFDRQTREEIGRLLHDNEQKEIVDRFYRDLAFGTGGMRGIMGAGTARMNVYNIRKASTAVALYLKEVHPQAGSGLKVAISYDSRRDSDYFAKCTAEVLAAHGIKALLTKQMRPVPMLSFMVRQFGCQAGVCITASHNPPEYNGFKVYWQSGGQLVPPHDEGISRHYQQLHDYQELKFLPYEQAKEQGWVGEVLEDLDEAYFAQVASLALHKQGREGFKIVYSPIHGTGIFAVPRALKSFGFQDIVIPPEQAQPDGRFPTVSSPNPEDPEALTMALAVAQREKADLVLATDPDTDRIGLIVREQDEFRSFNGNQLGCLLTEYVLASMQEAGKLPESPLVIKTIVTTELQREIAEHYGAYVEETLTGFKWICQLVEDYEQGVRTPYRQFVCGGEESYGFLAGRFVRDKDAIIACALAAEMVAYYKSQGLSLSQKLDEIFSRHQVYQESLLTLTLPGKEGAERISKIMNALRQQPLATLGGVEVNKVLDYERGVIKEKQAGVWQESAKLTLPRSDVLQLILADGSKVSIRPSGTEPKIKTYLSVVKESHGAQGEKLQAVKEQAVKRVKELEAEMTKLISNY